MVSFTGYILPLAAICSLVTALPQPPKNGHGNKNAYPTTDQYPLPNVGNVAAHDPNLLEHKESFYMFKGGVHIPIYKSTDLNGPWKQIGTVLPGDSVIKGYGNATRPWAPTTVEWKGKFYCFYSLSGAGDPHSAIGVASTSDIEKGHWKDHGKLMTTNDTNQGTPFNETNAIDPSFIVDKKTGTPYLNYGSYWKNIWQIPLEDDLLSLKNTTVGGVHPKKQSPSSSSSIIHHTSSTQHATPQPTPNAHVKVNASVHVGPKPDKRDNKKNNKGHNKGSDKDDKEDPHKGGKNGKDEVKNNNQGDKNARKVENKAAVQLTFMPNRKQRPEEGSWISHHDGYYYLWFSQGKCCDFKKDGLPPKGAEYVIYPILNPTK